MGSVQSTEDDFKHGLVDEVQLAQEGVVNPRKYLDGCVKNHGHSDLISVKSFSLAHIPVPHRDVRVLACVQAAADLTVRVEVRDTSSKRPEFWPNTRIPYPLYDTREQTNPRFGTGKIFLVRQYSDESNCYSHFSSCPCRKCQTSGSPSKVWGEVHMLTAAHVIYDDTEAKSATCRLFYDDDDSSVVELDGVIAKVEMRNDRCWLTCASCNMVIVNKLHDLVTTFDRLCYVVYKKNDNSNSSNEKDNMSFMVSHIHGGPKRVGMGKLINRYKKDCSSSFTYLTPTCPGSSGAPLYILKYKAGYSSNRQHIHIGVTESGAGRSNRELDFEAIQDKVDEVGEGFRELGLHIMNSTCRHRMAELDVD